MIVAGIEPKAEMVHWWFATGILVLPVRHPVVLAKEISTLCHLSDNRYVFGVGPGWYTREFEVTGSRIEQRGRRTDEIIEAVTLLLTRPNASYQGKYYQFDDVTIEPLVAGAAPVKVVTRAPEIASPTSRVDTPKTPR